MNHSMSHPASSHKTMMQRPTADDLGTLPEAKITQIVELRDGETFELHASKVRHRIGENAVEMLAYNGSIPGPTLNVRQGSEVIVHFINETELESTVHWHGVRLDNRWDGVPYDTQAPVTPQSRFLYRVRFPDPGVYWYHPHMYEDYAQEMGLYGNIVVAPEDPEYWLPVNRECCLILDDVLMQEGRIAPFDHSGMERFGNVMLMNGETDGTLSVNRGEVVRLYLTSSANASDFRIHIPGTRMKLVGGDSGRVEREEFVPEVLLSPSERVVVDVAFDQPGECSIEHRTKSRSFRFGTFVVGDAPLERSFLKEFSILRHNPEFAVERGRMQSDVEREPDKTLVLRGDMPGMHHSGGGMHHDMMSMHHAMPSGSQMQWKLLDRDTGKVNQDIDWRFQTGDRVKVRLFNDSQAGHPMAHPIHFHGQRFLVLARDGKPNDNLVWKDTVLVNTGETVDVLVDMSNPGLWMAHCHIAEHAEGGMMFNLQVNPTTARTNERGERDDVASDRG